MPKLKSFFNIIIYFVKLNRSITLIIIPTIDITICFANNISSRHQKLNLQNISIRNAKCPCFPLCELQINDVRLILNVIERMSRNDISGQIRNWILFEFFCSDEISFEKFHLHLITTQICLIWRFFFVLHLQKKRYVISINTFKKICIFTVESSISATSINIQKSFH